MIARLSFILLLFTPFLKVRGQETLERTGKVNKHYRSVYHVLKSDKKIRHGTYQVFNGDTLIVEGLYDHGKKIGRWNFLSSKGKLEQRFNFSGNKLEYYNPDTTVLQFKIAHPLEPGDTIIYPAKIGSNALVFHKFIMKSIMMDHRVAGTTGEFELFNIFYLDENGKLIKWQKKVASLNFNRVREESFSEFEPDELLFTPARVNGQAVPSVIIHKTRLRTATSVGVRGGR